MQSPRDNERGDLIVEDHSDGNVAGVSIAMIVVALAGMVFTL